MSNKDYFFIAGLLAVFAACSSDDDMQSAAGQQELVPVTLSYQTQQADTRAAAGLTLNDDYIESGKEVTVQISDYNVNEYTKYTYTTGAAGALSLPPTNAPYYPLDNTHIDILAYFPGDAGIVFSIQPDQTTDANYVASDLMWATKLSNVGKTTSPRTLTFNHKMAKIRVNVTAGTQISQINSVTLKNVKPTVDFDQSDGTVTLKSDASATDVEMVKENTSASVSGAAVIPAQTLTGALLEIGVTKADATTGTATYAVDSKSFSENGVYTLNITVSWPEVGATTTVTDWDEGGTAYVMPLRPARVGDLYFSDGTWGSAADFPDKTPIGIVFCTPTSAKDQALGYYQGYVMALKDVNGGARVGDWCVSDLYNTQVTDVLYNSKIRAVQWENLTTDLDGLTHCRTALNGHTQSDLRAIDYAMRYTPGAPTSTTLLPNSGWYLPSVGQQYQWLIAFASSSTYYANIKNSSDWAFDSGTFELNYANFPNASSDVKSAMDTYINNKLSTNTNKALYQSFVIGEYIWSSTELDASHIVFLHFSLNGGIYLIGSRPKHYDCVARAVLAF